jgi:processive 1,2-diacylglycerol beta-glucosyltransferase
VGVGHLSAAVATADALREIDPGIVTRVENSYEYAALVVSGVVSNGYLRMVKTIPQMYRYIYDRAERATEVGRVRRWAQAFTAENLRPLMQRERPDAVVCTHAFPCGAMAEYKRRYSDAPPVVAIVTDFAVHGFWIHRNIDRYVVSTERMRRTLLARRVNPSAIYTTGIPVRAQFACRPQSKAALRERLQLPQDRAVVLLMGGGLGIAPLERMLGELDAVRTPLTAVVIAGRNARVERTLTGRAETVGYPVRALRFVDNVYDYMHAADVLVTKPGGLSSAEALVAGVPLILSKPLPGQEERNARVLVDAGAAVQAVKTRDLPEAVERVLSSAPLRERMGEAARNLARPESARSAATMIVQLINERKESVA